MKIAKIHVICNNMCLLNIENYENIEKIVNIIGISGKWKHLN